MAGKDNQDAKNMLDGMMIMSESYFAVFANFLAKTGSIEQAYRLTKDMFSAMFNQNANKSESLSIFWDQRGESN